MTLTTVTQQDREQSKTPLLPLVVIGIRGSHSKVDHMVNANNQPKSAGSFIVCSHVCFQGPLLTG